MKKYWFVYSLYWQESLAQRMSFLMERFRALVVVTSLFYLWNALLKEQPTFAGYDRDSIFTYLAGMTLLRSLVLATRTDEIPMEINQGRLSGYLLKPVNFFAYSFSRDLSEKSTNALSSLIEISLLLWLFRAPLQVPERAATWLAFVAVVALAVVLNFLIHFLFGCWGFWTSESSGPRFFLALLLEYTAGVFFPLDILPASVQQALHWLPSPYLIYFPLNVLLERVSTAELWQGMAIQTAWIAFFSCLAVAIWRRGVVVYGAEGA